MSIPAIHRSVCISRAGQQVRGEAVTTLCDKGVCEKGQGGEHWCLASFLHCYGGVCRKGMRGARRTSTILSPVTRSDSSAEGKAFHTVSLRRGAWGYSPAQRSERTAEVSFELWRAQRELIINEVHLRGKTWSFSSELHAAIWSQ